MTLPPQDPRRPTDKPSAGSVTSPLNPTAADLPAPDKASAVPAPGKPRAEHPTPVVLVHGIRLSGTMWRSHRDRLAAQRPVVAVDLPGHGSRAGQRFGIEAAADVIAEAIDSMAPSGSSEPGAVPPRALVVGISLGGYVAIAGAARHPERVAGLIAIGCTTVPTPALTGPYRAMARYGGGRGEWVQRQLMRLVLGRRAADMACAGGMFTAAVPDVLDAVLGIDVLAELASYPGPVWLVNGRRDHFRTEEDRFLAACRDGRLTLVPRAGHLVSLTRPDRTTELIEAAARELDPHKAPDAARADVTGHSSQ